MSCYQCANSVKFFGRTDHAAIHRLRSLKDVEGQLVHRTGKLVQYEF